MTPSWTPPGCSSTCSRSACGGEGCVGTLLPPDGEPGVVESFEIYYRLLGEAERKGVRRQESESPLEFEIRLGPLFAPGLASKATAAFNRACYGNLPPPEDDLVDLRSAIAGGAAS